MNNISIAVNNKPLIVIITGLSGSGKSCAVKALEDIGFFCIDNMPPQLIHEFSKICENNNEIKKVAIVTDIRGGELFLKLNESIAELQLDGINAKVLFLDCDTNVLARRFKETRRKHPLDSQFEGDIIEAIHAEREMLMSIKEVADYYIDTTYINISQFKQDLINLFLDNINESMAINCISFGFKHGIPNGADLVFDVRCLPNPFYIPELKLKTGLDQEVFDFVMNSEKAKVLQEKLNDMLDFLIPMYIHEGKSQLVIAFGCTGGHHRSVTFAINMYNFLLNKGLKTRILHRDINK